MAETWRVLEDPADAGRAQTPTTGPGPAAPGAATPPVWLVLAAGVVVVCGLAAWLLTSGTSGGAVAVNAAHAAQRSPGLSAAASLGFVEIAAAPSAALLVVEVNGAVRKPGVYRLMSGSRVGDAIAAAGGYGGRVDIPAAQALNLAAKVEDGQQVHVPSRGEQAATRAGTAAAAGVQAGPGEPTGPVDINAATSAQLEALPGIGPATAAKIISARAAQRFASVQELRERKIVGPSTLDKIRTLVTAN